jgi:hypothetical protein
MGDTCPFLLVPAHGDNHYRGSVIRVLTPSWICSLVGISHGHLPAGAVIHTVKTGTCDSRAACSRAALSGHRHNRRRGAPVEAAAIWNEAEGYEHCSPVDHSSRRQERAALPV